VRPGRIVSGNGRWALYQRHVGKVWLVFCEPECMKNFPPERLAEIEREQALPPSSIGRWFTHDQWGIPHDDQ
jgi:hypothetical protein